MTRLMREKNRPIHKLRPTKGYVPYTWCLVDPCRKGVKTEGCNVGPRKATCPACLREEKKGEAAKPLRRIIPFA